MSLVRSHETLVDGVRALLVYRLDGRVPDPQECEDLGEDAGFYEPKQERAEGDVPVGAVQVTEGFTGQLCDHEWGLWGFYSRNPYGQFSTCKKCGVFVATVNRRRSNKVGYDYDQWGLREHIWRRWLKRGPVRGSLAVQAHHQKGAT